MLDSSEYVARSKAHREAIRIVQHHRIVNSQTTCGGHGVARGHRSREVQRVHGRHSRSGPGLPSIVDPVNNVPSVDSTEESPNTGPIPGRGSQFWGDRLGERRLRPSINVSTRMGHTRIAIRGAGHLVGNVAGFILVEGLL